MQKIKVLHIIKSLGRGGAEMLLPETLKIHNQEKFEFHYLYFLPWKDQMVKTIEEAGGRVTCFSASNNIKLLQQYPKVIEYCKKNKIDIIHCHLPWSGLLGRGVFLKMKIPVVYTEHNIQERYHIATKIVNKYTFNYQSLALGVSKDVSKSIQKNISPNIPVKTLLNGVNTERFRRDETQAKAIKAELEIPADSFIIGNIAVFRKQKKILDWVRAFNKVHTKHPHVFGLLVGAGTQEEEIKSLISELKLEDKIKLPGLQEDTIPYFSAMDVFMMSSAFEGLPIALLEAMSMECAVVSTKAGGVVEALRDGKEGLLCEPGEWGNLARNVIILIEDQVKKDSLQKAARERVKNKFSLKKMVNELEQYYLKLSDEVEG